MTEKEKTCFVEFTYPSIDEIKAAQNACCGSCCNSCEVPAAYAWRKRDVDMSKLLDIAIERELTDVEKMTVKEHWFEQKTVRQIAEQRGTSCSTVSMSLNRAQKKLLKALSYAVMYQQGIVDLSIVPLSVARARMISQSRHFGSGSVGSRIRTLRVAENISRKKLSELMGIDERRIAALEDSSTLPNADELERFSTFFNRSLDYLIKGETA